MEPRRIVISGPPASGKSALAKSIARELPGATIVDFDAIARELGSLEHHDHPYELKRRVHREVERRLANLDGPAVVIRGAPRRADREALALSIGATEVIVLDVPAGEAKSRAVRDSRPSWTARAIDRWWQRYEPSPLDTKPRHGDRPDMGAAMTETADTATTETTTEVTTDTVTEDTVDHKAEAEKWKALARKHEEKAKANADAAKKVAELERQNMTDLEAAVDQARSETETKVRGEFGGRLASEAVRAAAAGRVADVDALLDGIDPTKFLGEDGEPDRDAITSWMDRIAPQVEEQDDLVRTLDLGQGARGAAETTNDPLQKALEKISHR